MWRRTSPRPRVADGARGQASPAWRGVRAAEGARLEIAYVPKGASRVQIPPLSVLREQERPGGRPRSRIERRALRGCAAPPRSGRGDRRRRAGSCGRGVLVLRLPSDKDLAPARRGDRRGAQRPGAAGAVTGSIDVDQVFWWRDEVTDRRDDSWHAGWIADQSAELVRGEARVARPGVVAVGEREIEYGNLVVATGSSPAVPPVEGIADVDYWTNREAVWRTRRRRASSSSAAARSGSSSRSSSIDWGLTRRSSSRRDTCSRASTPRPASCSASASRRKGSTYGWEPAPSGSRPATRASASSLLRRPGRGRAAPRRHRAAAERGRSRPRAARYRAHEVGDHRRRTNARRGTRLGDRRPERRRTAHACREVPGPSRRGQHRGR